MTDDSPINTNTVETTKTREKNCIFCDLISANDPNIILERQVRIVLFLCFCEIYIIGTYLPIFV